MDFEDSRQRDAFFAIHEGLPREGPGDRQSLERALDISGVDRSAALRVLDIGCGPGKQTLALAESLPRGTIGGIDLHPPFVEALEQAARAAGVGERIQARVGDMAAQVRAAYANVQMVLDQFGATMANVVDELDFVTDMDAVFGAMAKIRPEVYGGTPVVANTLIGTPRLAFPELMVEIRCIGFRAP